MSRSQPNHDAFRGLFYSPVASATSSTEDQSRQKQQQQQPKRMGTVFDYYSVVDDAKKGAKKLSDEAQREFDKASAKAQGKKGTIALYSPTYYAACTFGGLLACVSLQNSARPSPVFYGPLPPGVLRARARGEKRS